MSSTENNNVNLNRKTKAELLRELESSREILQQKETALYECQTALDEAQAEVQALQSVKEEPDEESPLLSEMEELRERIRELESDLEESLDFRKKLESKNREQQTLIGTLKKELSEAEEPQALIEELPTSAASFRVDVYSAEDHFQGRIRKLPTKEGEEGKPFNWENNDVMTQYINTFLKKEPAEEEPLPEPLFAAQEEILPGGEIKLKKVNFTVLDHRSEMPIGTLHHDQLFKIRLALEPMKEISGMRLPLQYNLKLYARRIADRITMNIGESAGQLNDLKQFRVDISSIPLQAGIYRLEAVSSFSFHGEDAAPLSAFAEFGPLVVY